MKTKYDTDKSEIEKKKPDTSGLVKKTDYNTKITDIEFIESSDLARIALTALTAVEEKILNLAKKTDNNTKISEIKK